MVYECKRCKKIVQHVDKNGLCLNCSRPKVVNLYDIVDKVNELEVQVNNYVKQVERLADMVDKLSSSMLKLDMRTGSNEKEIDKLKRNKNNVCKKV